MILFKDSVQIKIISSHLTHNIRKKVLWPHIKNNNYKLDIDDNNTTFHLGAFLDNTIISIGTFVKEKNPKFSATNQYRLRAMATSKKHRRLGVGKTLFLESLRILKVKKVDLLWCDARLNAIPFYKSLNMQSLNEIYEIINIGPHKTMYIYLN